MTYPSLRGADVLSSRARTLRVRSGPAAVWNTRVDRASSKDIRIGGSHHVRHHRTRRRARHVDPVRGDTPVGDGIPSRVGKTEGVAASVVGSAVSVLVGVDIPALLRARGVSVDDEVSVLVGERRVFGVRVVELRSAAARMKSDNDCKVYQSS
jgi:hypothetical protein